MIPKTVQYSFDTLLHGSVEAQVRTLVAVLKISEFSLTTSVLIIFLSFAVTRMGFALCFCLAAIQLLLLAGSVEAEVCDGTSGIKCGSCCCIEQFELIDCLFSSLKMTDFPPLLLPFNSSAAFKTVDFGSHCSIFIDVKRVRAVFPNLKYFNFATTCQDFCVTLSLPEPKNWIFENIGCIILTGSSIPTTFRSGNVYILNITILVFSLHKCFSAF